MVSHIQERSPCARVQAPSSDDSGPCYGTADEMQLLETVVGVVAAMLTSPLYISQVKKVRACQPTEDLLRVR